MVWREEELLATEILANITRGYGHFFMISRGRNVPTTAIHLSPDVGAGTKESLSIIPDEPCDGSAGYAPRNRRIQSETGRTFHHFRPRGCGRVCVAHIGIESDGGRTTTIEVEASEGPITLKTADVAQISGDIMGQIYARDFKMVDQKRHDRQPGSRIAQRQARTQQRSGTRTSPRFRRRKEVYVVWACKGLPSPFITETATKVFKNTEEAIEYFRQKGYIK